MNANVLIVNYFLKDNKIPLIQPLNPPLLFLKQFFIFNCDFLKIVLLYQRKLIKQLFHKGE